MQTEILHSNFEKKTSSKPVWKNYWKKIELWITVVSGIDKVLNLFILDDYWKFWIGLSKRCIYVRPFLFKLKTGKEKEPKKDSFAEKMAAQIIKNLQIQIRNIHVRYEDAYTDPKNPFSIGVSLAELLFQVRRFSQGSIIN